MGRISPVDISGLISFSRASARFGCMRRLFFMLFRAQYSDGGRETFNVRYKSLSSDSARFTSYFRLSNTVDYLVPLKKKTTQTMIHPIEKVGRRGRRNGRAH